MHGFISMDGITENRMYSVNKFKIFLSLFLLNLCIVISKENEVNIVKIICTDSILTITYKNSTYKPIYFDFSSWIVEKNNKKCSLNKSFNFGSSFFAYDKNNKSILSFMNKYCENTYFPITFDFDYNLKSVPHIIEINSHIEFDIEFKINPSEINAFHLFDTLCVTTEFVTIDIEILKEFFKLIPSSQESQIINVEDIQNKCIYVDSNSISHVIEKYTLNKDRILYLENPYGEIGNDAKYFYQLLLTNRVPSTFKIKSPFNIQKE